MFNKFVLFLTCLFVSEIKSLNYVQYFDYITIKIYRDGVPVTLLDANSVKYEYAATEIFIEYESIPVLKSGTFSNLTKLKYLNLPRNAIGIIETNTFQNLPQLRAINLNFNRIQNITGDIFANLSISKLSLKGNGIKVLETMSFYNLTSLETLDLSSNDIEVLPDDLFFRTTNVKNINLNYNQLRNTAAYRFTSSPFAQPFTNSDIHERSSLDLSNNNLTSIDDYLFKEVYYIRDLLLNNNNIGVITENAFKDLECIGTVNLEGNYLEELPNKVLKVLEKTENIILENNPWKMSFVCKYEQWCKQNKKTNTVDITCTYSD